MIKEFSISKLIRIIIFVIALLLIVTTVFFYIKMDGENNLLNNFINEALDKKALTSREDTVMAISNAIYTSTNNWVIKDSMD